MGADFSSHQVFCGAGDHVSFREAAVQSLAGHLMAEGYVPTEGEKESGRSFVVGPPGRWLHVGDSAGSTERSDPEAFEAVSRVLSFAHPVADIQVSDSAAVHFSLYRAGALVDKYGNMGFPFIRFPTVQAAREYRGQPDLWADLLVGGGRVDDLRDAWTQWGGWPADTILNKTAGLFGWSPELVRVGYSHDLEGGLIRWDEYLQDEVDLAGFEEFHWDKDPARRLEP